MPPEKYALATPTTLSDVLKPTAVSDYITATLPDHNALIQSGAATLDLRMVATMGGDTLNLRKFTEDTTDAELDNGAAHTGAVQGSYLDIAVVTRRIRQREVNSAVRAAMGAGNENAVTDEIGRQSAYYWARETEKALVSVATGLFDASAGVLRATHKWDDGVTSGTPVRANYAGLVDAAALLGDNMEDFVALLCHSKHWAQLKKENAVKHTEIVPLDPTTGMPMTDEAGIPLKPIKYYDGKIVILWDRIARTGSAGFYKYTSLLVKRGAFGLGFQSDVETIPYYDGTRHVTGINQPCAFAPHVYGVKWIGTASSAAGPTNTELATAGNWSKVATNDKEIGVVAYVSN